VVFVIGFVIAAAGAALAFWTVTALSPSGSYALAQANSLSAPTTPTATVGGSGTITVGWTLPAGQLAGAQYQITRTTGPGSPTTVCTVASTVTSCQDTGLTGGTTYGYSVAAVLSSWQSAAITTSATTQKASQTITLTSTAPAAPTVGGATYTVTATASSGLAVAFSSASTSICTVSGSTVSFVGAGTCTLNADQAGNANYNAAPQVHQSFVVAKGAQTITFTSSAPATATVSGPTYTVTATASSGLAVAFSSATPTICTVSGSTVSFVGAGTCTLNANQGGDANYNTAAQVQQSFAVAKGDQTITFTSTAPAAATVGGATYTVTATASSGLTVAFTLDAASSGCSLSGSTVSFTAAGTCKVDANQAGDANYNAAPQVQQSFAVAKGAQTITFTSTAPSSAAVGGPTYTVTATSSSGLAVTITLDVTSTGCSLSGSTVSFTTAGTCKIDANQSGNTNYNAAPQVQQSITVTTTLVISTVVRNGGNKKVNFSGTGAVGGAITITICTANSFPCTAGNTAGTSTVAAVPANGSWTSTQDNNNLNDNTTYFAQAVETGPSATSAVFSFTVTNL
jgi:hypothetical protein